MEEFWYMLSECLDEDPNGEIIIIGVFPDENVANEVGKLLADRYQKLYVIEPMPGKVNVE